MVHFVGAGPGAPDLITLRGAELVKQADIIIYAGSLVNPEILALARPDCRVYNSAEMTLEQVLAVVKAAEAAGKPDWTSFREREIRELTMLRYSSAVYE